MLNYNCWNPFCLETTIIFGPWFYKVGPWEVGGFLLDFQWFVDDRDWLPAVFLASCATKLPVYAAMRLDIL